MYKLVTAPTLAQVKGIVPFTDILTALGKSTDDTDPDTSDNRRISDLIMTAYLNVEKKLGVRKIFTQTWDYFTDEWEDSFLIELSPLASVTSVKYYDSNNSQQTLVAGTDYIALTDINEVKMLNTYTLYARNDAISIRFVCGEASIRADLKEAITEELYGLFNREDRTDRIRDLIYDYVELPL